MATKREPTPWWTWLEARMKELDITAAELERRSAGDITSAAISYWKSGPHSAAPDKAIRVAEVLNADPAEALAAAGHDVIARVVGPNAAPVEQTDPVVAEIMAMTHLGMKVRQALVSQYWADQEEARRRARNLAKAWSPRENGDSDGSAA